MFIFKNITKAISISLGLVLLQQAQAMQEITVQFINVKASLDNVINNSPLFNNFKKSGAKRTENPQIIVWYSGEEGLSQRCCNFYNASLFTPIQKKYSQNPYCIYAYDLSAWKGLKDVRVSLTRTDCKPEINLNIKSIFSRKFFKYLEKAQDTELETLQEILKQEFIWKKSQKYQENKLKLKDLQDTYSPTSLQEIQDIDTSKIYSGLQYLEGLWLTKTILAKNLDSNNSQDFKKTPEVSIIFLLPNDELEYYQESKSNPVMFEKDIQKLINADTKLKELDFNLTIYFQKFSYSYKDTENKTNPCMRPYLTAPTDTIILKPKQNLETL